MKRSLDSSDSLGALISICPQSTDDQCAKVYGRDFQSMLEGLEEEGCCIEESGNVNEKKRRLSAEQVKALEKNFEVENKLEPERKVKLAQELGLQPRQVAVWFQNRRARWKTKQLERDYGTLKANYDALKVNVESLHHDNEALIKEIRELKAKLKEKNTDSNISIKEEIILPESDDKLLEQDTELLISTDTKDFHNETLNENNNNLVPVSLFPDFKDGSSDSDSSAILNEDNATNNINSPNYQAISSSGVLGNHHLMVLPPSLPAYHHTQYVKMEEHNFFSSEEACSFFSDEQAPSLQWYCNDQWN